MLALPVIEMSPAVETVPAVMLALPTRLSALPVVPSATIEQPGAFMLALPTPQIEKPALQPLNFEDDDPKARRQTWSLVLTKATARVSIVTFGRNRLAKNVFCCCDRMTSTAFWFPAKAPRTGGLLTHILPGDGFVQAGVVAGHEKDLKVKLLRGGAASRWARAQISG